MKNYVLFTFLCSKQICKSGLSSICDFFGWGYTHDGRADKDPYPHDRRADKDSYPHDRMWLTICVA